MKHGFAFSDYRNYVDASFVDTSSPSNPLDKSPLVHFTSSFLERTIEVNMPVVSRCSSLLTCDVNRQIMQGFGASAVQLHDPAAVWCALCNPPNLGHTNNGPKVAEEWQVKKRVFKIER